MNTQRSADASVLDEKETCEVFLEQLDHYIIKSTKEFVRYSSHIINPAVSDLETDELIQRVRVKLWNALERGTISYPQAYIRCIIHTEILDLKRRQKRFAPLFSYDDPQGPLQQEHAYSIAQEPDPADEVEQHASYLRCLKNLVQAVLKLPPRQQYAIICSLKDRVDDEIQLVNGFKESKIDIGEFRWPIKKAEKQLLQSSLSAARRSLAKHLSS